MIYVARHYKTHELVAVICTDDEEDDVMVALDECCDPSVCEIAEIDTFGVIWPKKGADRVPLTYENEDGPMAGSTLTDETFEELSGDLEWHPTCEGFVYILECAGRYKIGYSTNVEARVASLQTGAPFPIKLVHSFPADRRDEKMYHEHYAEYRRHGEWFDLTENELRMIMGLG